MFLDNISNKSDISIEYSILDYMNILEEMHNNDLAIIRLEHHAIINEDMVLLEAGIKDYIDKLINLIKRLIRWVVDTIDSVIQRIMRWLGYIKKSKADFLEREKDKIYEEKEKLEREIYDLKTKLENIEDEKAYLRRELEHAREDITSTERENRNLRIELEIQLDKLEEQEKKYKERIDYLKIILSSRDAAIESLKKEHWSKLNLIVTLNLPPHNIVTERVETICDQLIDLNTPISATLAQELIEEINSWKTISSEWSIDHIFKEFNGIEALINAYKDFKHESRTNLRKLKKELKSLKQNPNIDENDARVIEIQNKITDIKLRINVISQIISFVNHVFQELQRGINILENKETIYHAKT